MPEFKRRIQDYVSTFQHRHADGKLKSYREIAEALDIEPQQVRVCLLACGWVNAVLTLDSRSEQHAPYKELPTRTRWMPNPDEDLGAVDEPSA
jgi:hypothetical protein